MKWAVLIAAYAAAAAAWAAALSDCGARGTAGPRPARTIGAPPLAAPAEESEPDERADDADRWTDGLDARGAALLDALGIRRADWGELPAAPPEPAEVCPACSVARRNEWCGTPHFSGPRAPRYVERPADRDPFELDPPVESEADPDPERRRGWRLTLGPGRLHDLGFRSDDHLLDFPPGDPTGEKRLSRALAARLEPGRCAHVAIAWRDAPAGGDDRETAVFLRLDANGANLTVESSGPSRTPR